MGPEIRTVDTLHGTRPMQSVNKYIDKGHRANENCQCQESKRWEGGGRRGAVGMGIQSHNQCPPSTSALDTAVPVTSIWKTTHSYHMPLLKTLALFFFFLVGGGRGRAETQPPIQH